MRFGAARSAPLLCALGQRWAVGAVGRVVRPRGAAAGLGVVLLFAVCLDLLGGADRTHAISLRFGFVCFVIELDFVFSVGVLLYLSVLGRIGAGNDVIQELVLLLVKGRRKKFGKGCS